MAPNSCFMWERAVLAAVVIVLIEECVDTHQYCGSNPGWPQSWCDSEHQYVLDKCPKFCGLCREYFTPCVIH